MSSSRDPYGGWHLGGRMMNDGRGVEMTVPPLGRQFNVLDFGHMLAGPFATKLLRDVGGSIIKVEQPPKGDPTRYHTPESGDVSGQFAAYNAGKKSIVVDLSIPEGREIAHRLVKWADVMLNNFRPGVMNKFNLGADTTRLLNPQLIYCSISGFGSRGPLASRGANDVVIQAFSGLMSLTGEEDGDPVRVGASIVDLSTGVFAALGIVTALNKRTLTGVGSEIQVSMLGSILSLLGANFTDYWASGALSSRAGTGTHRMGQPNGGFATADGMVVFAAATDRLWSKVCQALGLEELIEDPRFLDREARLRNRTELNDEITKVTRTKTTDECVKVLALMDVPVAPLNSVNEMAAEEQLVALDLIRQVDVIGNRVPAFRIPIDFEGNDDSSDLVAPQLGGNTQEILQMVGYSGPEIDALSAKGAVVLPPRP